MVKAVCLAAVTTLAALGKVHEDTGRIIKPAATVDHPPGAILDLPASVMADLEIEGAVRKATREDIAAAEAKGLSVRPVPDPVDLAAAAEAARLKAATVEIPNASANSELPKT